MGELEASHEQQELAQSQAWPWSQAGAGVGAGGTTKFTDACKQCEVFLSLQLMKIVFKKEDSQCSKRILSISHSP